MHKIILPILCAIALLFAQKEIPPPSEIANFTKKTFPDDTVYINKSIEASNNLLLYLDYTQNIGDFDGDGSEELYLIWRRQLIRKFTLKATGEQFVGNVYTSQSALYSFKKNSYLITGPFPVDWDPYNPWPDRVLTGDFNGDNFIEFLIGNKVYSSTTPIVKKNQ